jgi:hypothetical protein
MLCDEIGFVWHPRLERLDIFVAFVRALQIEVGLQRQMQAYIAANIGGKPPSDGSAEVLALADEMLKGLTREALIEGATLVHQACDRLNPEDAYPTDHLIDMLQSCASAIQFGLEIDKPYRSRHAAAAAQQIWKQLYGLARLDEHTTAWSKDWARAKLIEAVVSLLPGSP